MAKDLETIYDVDSFAFPKMLKAKEQSGIFGLKDRATNLLDGWIASKVEEAGVPSDALISHVLNLIHPKEGDLNISRFKASHMLMSKKYPSNDDSYLAMAIDLRYYYDTSEAFLTMLESVKKSTKDPAAKELATKLNEEWRKFEGDKSKAHAKAMTIRVLELMSPDDNVLSTSRFKVYLTFKERVTTRGDLYKEIAKDLETIYNKDSFAFSKMLVQSAKDPSLKDLAANLRNEWITLNVECNGVSPLHNIVTYKKCR